MRALRSRSAGIGSAGRTSGGRNDSSTLRAELVAGNWDAAERGVEEACETIAATRDPGAVGGLRSGPRDRRRASRKARTRAGDAAAYRAERAGILWWEALRLSGLAFVEHAAGNHAEVDRAVTRMHELMDSVGVRDFLPDRSEPIHVESLVALGELERAREELARLEERGRMFPRLWITVALPRARALVLEAEGDVTGALAALDELDLDAAVEAALRPRSRAARSRPPVRRAKQKRAAADTMREALAIFERLGAPAWEAQAQGRARPRRPQALAGRADGDRAPRRRAHRDGADQPRGGEQGVHEPEDGAGQPHADLPQARDQLPRRARRAHGGRTRRVAPQK